MNYSDARAQIREGVEYLLEQGKVAGAVASIVQDELRSAQRAYRRRHHERGPWPGPPQRCTNSEIAGRWGATGEMPPAHFWYWANDAHTAGYLACMGTGTPAPGNEA